MILIIDNYDSFTYNIYHYLGEIGVSKIKVFRNNKISLSQIEKLNPKAIFLSPGPCTPDQAGICLDLVKKLHQNYPIMGICLGHQSIGQAFGSKIIQAPEIQHGKVCEIKHNKHLLFENIPLNFKATRYHSLMIDNKNLHNDLEIIAETHNNIIMAIAHKKYNLCGVQFHPESIGTEKGKTILSNYLSLIKYAD